MHLGRTAVVYPATNVAAADSSSSLLSNRRVLVTHFAS